MTGSKLTKETLEQGVKCNILIWKINEIYFIHSSSVFIVNFEPVIFDWGITASACNFVKKY